MMPVMAPMMLSTLLMMVGLVVAVTLSLATVVVGMVVVTVSVMAAPMVVLMAAPVATVVVTVIGMVAVAVVTGGMAPAGAGIRTPECGPLSFYLWLRAGVAGTPTTWIPEVSSCFSL